MLEKIVLFGSITVMLIVTAIEVLDAKVLHANLMWTTEVNRIMLVWCILFRCFGRNQKPPGGGVPW